MKLAKRVRAFLLERDNAGLIILLLGCFSLTAAVMHYAFVALKPDSVYHVYQFQTNLLFHPGKEARLLSGALIYGLHFVLRKMFLALIAAEWLFAFFSFSALYLLAQRIIKDRTYALLAVAGLMFYYPLSFQLSTSRFGEFLLFGLFFALVYLVLAGQELLFVLLLLIAATQRPEIAFSGVMFKLAYDLFERRDWRRAAADLLLIPLPFAVVWGINRFYAIDTNRYLQDSILLMRFLGNLKGIVLHLSAYAPIIVLALFNYRRLGRIVYLMLLALVPYLAMITIAGNYSESRLFLPFAGVLLIGVCYAIKNKGVFTLEKLIS